MTKNKKAKAFLLFGIIAGIMAPCCLTAIAENAEENAPAKFPETYEREGDLIYFSCKLNLPPDFDETDMQKVKVTQVQSSDYEKVLSYLKGDRTIESEYLYPAEGNVPEWRYYTFDDYTAMGAGGTTFFTTQNSSHYSNAFSRVSEIEDQRESIQLAFATSEECEEQLVQLMQVIGLEWEGTISSYALEHGEASQWEEHLSQEGGLDEEQYKQDWNSSDDAYLLYGYQKFQGLPVYHELMGIGGSMKYFNADNAAVQAIITAGGLQKLYIHYLYDLQGTGEQVILRPFEEIADTVAFKLGQSLTGEQYKVTAATLMEMVRHSQNQDYEALPIWYVEAESELGTTVVLVNAETAEEIFVQ